jgi:hypothetical protein
MPEIRYTIRIEGDEFWETIRTKRGDANQIVWDEVIAPMNKRRTALGEPLASLVKVEVLNPFVHLHHWQFTYKNRSSLRSFYVCKYCEATGYIPLNIVTGETATHIIRDEKYKTEKWEVCRDALKKLDHKLSFR